MYDYLQKIRRFGTIQLLAVLCLAILPQVSFGQTPTLDNLHLGSNQPQPQCLDFNQDRVCEFIVLANGTMVDNPINQRPIAASTSQPESSPQQGSGQKLLPGGAYDFPKCLGHISDGCENILLSNGTMIKNPRNQSMTIYVQDYQDSGSPVKQAQGQTVEDEAGSSGDGSEKDDGDELPDCIYRDEIINKPCFADDGEVVCGEFVKDKDAPCYLTGGEDSSDEEEIDVDDVESFEGGDSEETATDDREYDPEGDIICGNDETGEEWTC